MLRELWGDPYSRVVLKMSSYTVLQAVVMIFYAVNA